MISHSVKLSANSCYTKQAFIKCGIGLLWSIGTYRILYKAQWLKWKIL
jgi:hypothetical protein